MKKLLATVVALSCATVMLLGTAFADQTFYDGIEDGNVEIGDGSWSYAIPEENFDDIATAASVVVTFTVSSLDSGFGGGFIVNSSGAGAAGSNWNSVEWGNADAEKAISAVETGNDMEFTITRDDVSGLFGTTEDQYGTYNKVCLQSWWGADITVSKVELLDASGNVLYTTAVSSTANTTTEDNPTTGDAMNIVMIAGLAVVALGGVVVCARKKNA